MVRASTGKDSKQDYATPDDLKAAVEHKFGPIAFDLAAQKHNTKSPLYFCPPGDNDPNAAAEDSFAQSWSRLTHSDAGLPRDSILWLNPPFKKITPWAFNCAQNAEFLERGIRIALCVPASVGSCWYANMVEDQAFSWFLTGRPSFDGVGPFPKDIMVSIFGSNIAPGNSTWDWRNECT